MDKSIIQPPSSISEFRKRRLASSIGEYQFPAFKSAWRLDHNYQDLNETEQDDFIALIVKLPRDPSAPFYANLYVQRLSLQEIMILEKVLGLRTVSKDNSESLT